MNQTRVLLAISFILSFSSPGCLANQIKPSTGMDASTRAKRIYTDLKEANFLFPPENSTASEIAAFENKSEKVVDALEQLKNSKNKEAEVEAIKKVSSEMQSTGYLADVIFYTERDGARVKYQQITEEDVKNVSRLTNSSEPYNLPIGTYRMWTERNGEVTSPKEEFDIFSPYVEVGFEEQLP
ncbi:hypothetical protein [Candidatus Nitrospira neomarina]|uniref:Lipoprotein n=1 Tax=Candidatus Nitrospira neomarina TaxID=3020899 RepID=A0AA96GGF3_9BACT|nr:hypothetical protein [Candidatus Nitrospira neomarina]WNM61914.1 hypothetical protein PQG83_19565 [Candidatus Nitrospira neomarina]